MIKPAPSDDVILSYETNVDLPNNRTIDSVKLVSPGGVRPMKGKVLRFGGVGHGGV